jgi:hypothetical protein
VRGSIHAELTKMVHRPATWLLVVIAVVLELTSAYLVPYAGATDGDDAAAGGQSDGETGVAVTMPDQLVGNALGGTPVFVGALALVLGVLVVGSEYGCGTWKTVLGQGPSNRRRDPARTPPPPVVVRASPTAKPSRSQSGEGDHHILARQRRASHGVRSGDALLNASLYVCCTRGAVLLSENGL